MTVEPRNAASDFVVEMWSNWSNRQFVETELAEVEAEDYLDVLVDR